MISAKKLTLTTPSNANNRTILNNVSFEIPQGRITFFLGKSGAGKTSLMKCIAQLQPNYTGNIAYNGIDIKSFSPRERAKHIGFVFQQFNLFPHMTVLENCINPLIHVIGLSRALAEKRASEALEQVEMSSFAQQYPSKLSGGQQQRAAIARALGLNPQFLLFDEPTSALDPENSRSLQQVIIALLRQGITIAIASHDTLFVQGLIDKVYFLEDGAIVERYDQQKSDVKDCPRIAAFLTFK